jgi:hypothetical protein
MFKLRQETTSKAPAYMQSNLDLKSLGIQYRLVPPSVNAPDSVAANAYVEMHADADGQDVLLASVRVTVWNSQNRAGEIYVTGPSRQYERTNAQGTKETRRSQDVLFGREVLNALTKAIHLDLEGQAEVPDQDVPSDGAELPADFVS